MRSIQRTIERLNSINTTLIQVKQMLKKVTRCNATANKLITLSYNGPTLFAQSHTGLGDNVNLAPTSLFAANVAVCKLKYGHINYYYVFKWV